MPAMTEPDKSFGALWQAQRTFANTDAERAAWDVEDAAMRQPANADEAYELRVRNKQLSLLPGLLQSQITDLKIQLIECDADPDGSKTRELLGAVINRLQETSLGQHVGGKKTGRGTSAKAAKHQKLMDAAYLAVNAKMSDMAHVGICRVAYPEYEELAKIERLKPRTSETFRQNTLCHFRRQ